MTTSTSRPPEVITDDPGDGVRKAGRGGLAIAAAKIYFILMGFVQQVAFGHILGLGGYGALSSALSAGSIVTNPITQASIQGMSREIAGAPLEQRPLVLRHLLRLHTAFAVAAAALFFLLAEPLAHWLRAPHIAAPLRILSSILLLYGVYTPLVGALNGAGRFVSQAALDVMAATLRTVGLLGGAYWATRSAAASSLGGPAGAAIGFGGAALAIMIIALVVVGVGRSGGSSPAWTRYGAFMLPLLFGQGLLNLLFQADGLLLRRFASEAALASGLGPATADPFVGAYRAAQLFGFLPYQLLMSVTFILFPLLAQANALGNRELVRDYVRSGLRLALLLAGLMAGVLIGVPRGLIALAYTAEAADLGAGALRILGVGLGFLAVLGVMTSALNSLGASRGSLLVTATALASVVGLCWFTVRGQPLGPDLLGRTAMATSIGLGVACALAVTLLFRLTGALVRVVSLLRVLLATLACSLLGAFLEPAGRLPTLLTSAASTLR